MSCHLKHICEIFLSMTLALGSILFLLLRLQTVPRNWQDHIVLWRGETGCCGTRPVSNMDENDFSAKAPLKDQAYTVRFNLNEQYILIPYIWKIPPLTLYCVSNNKDLNTECYIWYRGGDTVQLMSWFEKIE